MRPVHVLGLCAATGFATVGTAVWLRRRKRGLAGVASVNVPYVTNIEQATLKNKYYRKVLTTSPHSQLVLMALKPKEAIGMEMHSDTDQFLRVERGTGKAILDGRTYRLHDGSAVTVPAGTRHNIINTSPSEPLKLYTIYSPAKHAPGTLERRKPVHE